MIAAGTGTAALLSAGTWAWLRQRGYSVDPGPDPHRAPRAPVRDLPSKPFDMRAAAVLGLLLDQLLPGDPEIGLPSAVEAGVPVFLDRACRHRGLRAVRADVLKLCRDLDLRARRRFEQRYSQLTPEARDRLVSEVRDDRGSGRRYSPQRALQTTLRIALEGYLGHPQHGGNQRGAVWAALTIPMPMTTEGMGH